MPAVLSKFLSTPLTDDVLASVSYRVGHNGFNRTEMTHARAYAQRVISDRRLVQKGLVELDSLSPQSRSFIESLGRVRKYAEES